MEGARKFAGASFIRTLIPFTRAPPNELSTSQRPHLLIPFSVGIRISKYEFEGDINIQIPWEFSVPLPDPQVGKSAVGPRSLSGPITSWQIDVETIETVTDFIFLGSKITADGDCSHEIKRRLFLGRKMMTNLDSMLKSRDITLSTKLYIVKATVFPVVMYGCESCSIKKAECQKMDAFELWYWRRLLRVPWTARRSNQSILKKISLEYSVEGLMLKLKLQYSGHLM